MAPDELVADVQRELRQEFGGAFAALQFQTADAGDKTAFAASFALYPAREKYAQRVEEALAAERSAGRNHSREAIYRYLKTADDETRGSRLAPSQRRAAAARVADQRARPVGGRGDGAPAGRRPAAGTPEADQAILDEARRSGRSPWG